MDLLKDPFQRCGLVLMRTNSSFFIILIKLDEFNKKEFPKKFRDVITPVICAYVRRQFNHIHTWVILSNSSNPSNWTKIFSFSKQTRLLLVFCGSYNFVIFHYCFTLWSHSGELETYLLLIWHWQISVLPAL